MVAAVLAGDRDAYRGLVEREADGLVRACHRVLGDLHEAEDVAQEAFIQAYRALPAWRGEGTFGAWLTRIGIRLAMRRAATRRRIGWIAVEPGTGRGASSAAGSEDRLVDERTGAPDEVVIAAERAQDVRSAVGRLDEPYREVVALRFFGERSLAEIGIELGRPVPTVKTQLRRGLLRLRSLLEEGAGPSGVRRP